MENQNTINKTVPARARLVLLFVVSAGAVLAQTTLPDFVVTSARVANQSSVGTIDMPVSALRYEPRVDVQSRNLAEAQADIAVRGGHFESTGFQVGAVALGDPQTGHYSAEIPVPPGMLMPPEVVVGGTNALEGFNATAGTVRYGWRPVEKRAIVAAAMGDNGYSRQSVYAGTRQAAGDHQLGADVD